ncbi:uncharacterized protein LOC131029382 [Cryptomeria japonica]|uniref:uncharacterized protein LOC131029382 n=1 Tax=Cryptomeria japonica TaxID=3369 RepID=UPI0025ACAD45|nr:uncharacterized protein LOC131029382 [Cryptomeria japonica]
MGNKKTRQNKTSRKYSPKKEQQMREARMAIYHRKKQGKHTKVGVEVDPHLDTEVEESQSHIIDVKDGAQPYTIDVKEEAQPKFTIGEGSGSLPSIDMLHITSKEIFDKYFKHHSTLGQAQLLSRYLLMISYKSHYNCWAYISQKRGKEEKTPRICEAHP